MKIKFEIKKIKTLYKIIKFFKNKWIRFIYLNKIYIYILINN